MTDTDPEEVKTLIENSENLTTTYLGTRESRMGVKENVGIHDENRLLNVMNIGPIGHGKTQMMVHAALQDIHSGRGVCLVTPKGDAIDQLLAKIPEDREDDVIYLNPNEEPVTKINVLEPHVDEDMTRAQLENQKEIIVSDMVDLFRRYSKEWGDRFGRVLETLLRAHLDLNIRYDERNTLIDVYNAVVDDDAMRELIDKTDNEYIQNQLLRVKDLSDRELDPLQRRLDDFVMNDTVRRVIDTDHSSVNFRDVVNDSKILLVDVQKGEVGRTVSELVGSIVITQIWAAAQSRISMPEEERDPFFMFIDEVHNFAGEGSNFAKILAEAREYGLGIWIASQFLNQMEAEMRRSITNNCRTKIFFNPSGSEDVSQITGMLQGVDKNTLTSMGKFRAVMQQPSQGEYNGAVTFDTFPPWEVGRDPAEVEELKVAATVAEGGTAERMQQRRMQQNLGPAGNAGDRRHQELLSEAKEYLEARPEVAQVNLLYQEPGEERPDGHILKTNGTVAHLEAEVSTLSKPVKVLRNYRRAAAQDRKCVFVVEEGEASRLENIVADPVNRRGDGREDEQGSFAWYTDEEGEAFTDVESIREGRYRVLKVGDNGVIDHAKGSDPDCPELPDNDRDELETFCMYRDQDGMCELLEQPCVIAET